jgi:hypothetical protein
MQRVGEKLLASIKGRLQRGMNCSDAPARPLKPGRISKGRLVTRYGAHGKVAWTDVVGAGRQLPGYPDYKAANGLQPIRDWRGFARQGMRTINQMQVTKVSDNRGVIGFLDSLSARIAYINNAREKQFGTSPKDLEALRSAGAEEMRAHPPIKVQTEA